MPSKEKATVVIEPQPSWFKSKCKDIFSEGSNFIIFINFLEFNMGPTLLTMPMVFMYGGLIFSPFAFMIMLVYLWVNTSRLVWCAQHLSKREGIPVSTYSDVAYVAMSSCTETTKSMATVTLHVINVLILSTRLDGCAILMVFISRNLQSIVTSLTIYDTRLVVFCWMPFLFCTVSIRTMCRVTPFSLLAWFAFITSTVLIVGIYVVPSLPGLSDHTLVGDLWGVMRFISVVLYVMSGLSASIAIQSKMKKPDDFVYNLLLPCFFMLLIVYTAVGFFGYLKFGDKVMANIVFNIEPSDMVTAIKWILLLASAASIPIILYLSFNLVNKHYILPFVPKGNRIFVEFFVRYLMCAVIFLLAVILPAQAPMIKAKGAFFHAILESILPPILNLITYYPEKGFGPYKRELILTIILSGFGLYVLTYGGYIAGSDIYHELLLDIYNYSRVN